MSPPKRDRASVVDTSGFVPRVPAPVDSAAVAAGIADTPFARRGDAPAKRHGRQSRGQLSAVSARVPIELVRRLERLRAIKSWTLVAALERAIDMLATAEGVD